MNRFPLFSRRSILSTVLAAAFAAASFTTSSLTTAGLSAEDLLPEEGPQPSFRRGDTDGSTEVNLTDAVSTLGFLFVGDKKIECADAADANDDGQITIADAVSTLSFLFVGNLRVPSPGAFQCGEDPTEDALHCEFAFECRPRVLAVPPQPTPERPPSTAPLDPQAALIAAFPAIEAQLAQTPDVGLVAVFAEPLPPKAPKVPVGVLKFQKNTNLFQVQVLDPAPPADNDGPANAESNVNVNVGPAPTNQVAPEDRSYGPCGVASLFPTFVTDGQRVNVRNQDLVADRVRLNGFRYDIVPSLSTPSGENRELIFSDCVVLGRETRSDPDGVPDEQRFFEIPMDAPTGEYDVYIDSGCPVEAPEDCVKWSRLYVTQASIVTTVPEIRIVGNSEDDKNSPAELNFQFASEAGEAVQQGNAVRFPTMLSGSFPAGGNGSSHMTHPDDSSIFLSLPIFVGDESTMALDDCLEECAAFPEDLQDLCMSQCQSRGYSNHFEFSFAGFEKDSSGSKIWGAAAGFGAAALGCYASVQVGQPVKGCTASAGLGVRLADVVNNALSDDDDHLGVVSETFQYGLNGFRWGPVGRQGPVRFGGNEKNNGTVDLFYENRRAGAPHIVQYAVRILSIKLLKGYEFSGCDAPNEVFINARAHLHEGQTNLSGPVRFPSGNDVWKMRDGDTASFGGGLLVAQDTYGATVAPTSPILYVEFSVWEDDKHKDLMGNHARTYFLTDLLSAATEIRDTTSSDGYPVRRSTMRTTKRVHGYPGSDGHCSIFASGFDPNGIAGQVDIRYEVEVTALKNFPR
jgi:hypothetical protein